VWGLVSVAGELLGLGEVVSPEERELPGELELPEEGRLVLQQLLLGWWLVLQLLGPLEWLLQLGLLLQGFLPEVVPLLLRGLVLLL
jgi:hypothetical protein